MQASTSPPETTIKQTGIGICTCRRNNLLDKCLESLFAMGKPDNTGLVIIIADNDADGSAQEVAKKYENLGVVPVLYAIEPRQGIAFARNNILNRAKALNIKELAFIDDDENASPDWLINLSRYYNQAGADVVRGPVMTIYPDNTPQWILDGRFYQRENHQTGSVFQWANTGNVFFNFNKLVNEWGLWFNTDYGLSGGEDLDFFIRAYEKGALILWADNAVVYEVLDKKCFRVSYLLKRRFRENNDKHHFKGLSLKKKIKTLLIVLIILIWELFLLPIKFFKKKYVGIRGLESMAESCGYLLGLLGVYIHWQEYKQ